MDQKQRKQKKKTLNLPRPSSVVNFHSHHQPFSPGRDHQRRYGEASSQSKLKGFSGLMVPVIPEEIRRRRNGRYETGDATDDEPTSPKISCIGQIKLKKEMKRRAHAAAKKAEQASDDLRYKGEKVANHKKGSYSFKKFFKRSSSDVSNATSASRTEPVVTASNPGHSLGQMKKFASGREGLKDFDWKSHVRTTKSELPDFDSDGDEEPIIPFSAPMSIGGSGSGGRVSLKPREEINLWKRRTMTPPAPLILR